MNLFCSNPAFRECAKISPRHGMIIGALLPYFTRFFMAVTGCTLFMPPEKVFSEGSPDDGGRNVGSQNGQRKGTFPFIRTI